MNKHGVQGYTLLIVLGLAWLVGQARPLSAQQTGGLPDLAQRVAALEARVNALQQTNTSQAAQIAALQSQLVQDKATLTALNARLLVVEAKTVPISVVGTDFMITGKNVFIQDGSGQTDGDTGLGNLTIGYNALRGVGYVDDRTGTHNLILGDLNNYSSFGGLVVGYFNTISNEYTVVSGGFGNVASGRYASVSGGSLNAAENTGSSVSGGSGSAAEGVSASVSGGFLNRAVGTSSSVSGGELRVAPAENDWVAGSLFQDH
jgi:hypothetical protein